MKDREVKLESLIFGNWVRINYDENNSYVISRKLDFKIPMVARVFRVYDTCVTFSIVSQNLQYFSHSKDINFLATIMYKFYRLSKLEIRILNNTFNSE